MSLHTGFFPSYGHRRKQTIGGYRLHLNNQQHHPASSLPSARSSADNANTSESFLPSIVTMNAHQDGHRPFRRNDFANNHLFLAKRKLARVFLAQPTKSLQATSDLIHLFDQQGPKYKHRNGTKSKHQVQLSNLRVMVRCHVSEWCLQENVVDMKVASPLEQDAHLSVINLALKPPFPSLPPRDPLSTMSRQSRSQAIHSSSKVSRQPTDSAHTAVKQSFPSSSLHAFVDSSETDGLIDNDNASDTISTTINPFDSSMLCVKAIIPSAGPSHANHHALQHRWVECGPRFNHSR